MKYYPITEHKNILETLIRQLRDLLNKIVNHELKQYGITLKQLAVLDIVSILGGKTSPKELSMRLLRQPHTVSSLLIRMEQQGLINRDTDPVKKVSVNITLTEKGEHILIEARKLHALQDVTSCLSEQELQQLTVSLKKLRDSAINKLAQINSPFFT